MRRQRGRMRHRLLPPRDDDDDDDDADDEEEEYDSAKWFTLVLGGETFQDAVRRVKESVRWCSATACSKIMMMTTTTTTMMKKEEEEEEVISACVQEGRASAGAGVHRRVLGQWPSWLVRGRGGWTRRRSWHVEHRVQRRREGHAVRLSEWMWSVSAKSSEWLQEQLHKQDHKALVRSARRSAKRPRWCSPKAAAVAEEEEEEDDEEEPPLSALSSPPASPSSPPDSSSPPPPRLRFPDSSGVLKYEDAFRYWTYEPDVRWRDPFIGDVGGNAYQIASDRWRHAFHHMPNRQFAEQLLRICTASTAKGLPRCKRKKTKKKKQRRCVMCNRQRQCDEYVLGALSPSFAAGGVLAVALGCCCLRKLEAVIALYKALQDVRALREKPQPGSGNSFASTTDDDDDVFEAVRGPVDRFNRAVDELDQAMGMDQQYRVYGSSGGGFYNVGPFGDEA